MIILWILILLDLGLLLIVHFIYTKTKEQIKEMENEITTTRKRLLILEKTRKVSVTDQPIAEECELGAD